MLNIYFNGADTSIVFYSWYSTIKLVLKFYLTIEKVLKYEQPLTKSRCPDHPTNCNERGGGGGQQIQTVRTMLHLQNGTFVYYVP